MKKVFYSVFSFLYTLQFFSCSNNKEVRNDRFRWQAAVSVPSGYLADVYTGVLISDNDVAVLDSPTPTGEWGKPTEAMGSAGYLPKRLRVTWVSYFEHKFYHIDTPIDYDKMVRLFNEGFYDLYDEFTKYPPIKSEYNKVVVGFAPGGVVVIWVAGIRKQVEIGRYQAEEITFSKEYIAGLSPGPAKNMHNIEYHNNILYNWGVQSQESIEKVKDKPIPYGIWDTYRKEYNWHINFDFPNNEKIIFVEYDFYNGENDFLLGEVITDKHPQIPDIFRWSDKVQKNHIPKDIYFHYMKDGNRYSCFIKFNEEDIFNAFEKITGGDATAEIEMYILVNQINTHASVILKNKNKEVALFNNEIKINKWS